MAWSKSLGLLVVLSACWGHPAMAVKAVEAADPFAPYLNSLAVPKATLSEEGSGSGTSAITTRKFTFASRGGVNTVYAILAQPQQAGTYPAILFLHGGGGNAETMAGYALESARRGYVGMAIDLPGICGTANTPNSSGPWKSRPAGEAPRFDMGDEGRNSTLLDAEAAALEAFNWLRSQPMVKAEAMGLNGQSWGGYSTTLLAGLLGSKVKAAYSVYGCGFYDKASFWKSLIAGLSPAVREAWIAAYDAGRRAPGIKAAYFLEAASNDAYFWPEAVSATLDAVPGARNHAWGPNLDHKRMARANDMQRIWFDHHLKGQGLPFASTAVTRIETLGDGTRRISIQVSATAGLVLDSVQVFHSVRDSNWTGRNWAKVQAMVEAGGGAGGSYSALLPAPPAGKTLDFYAQATDSRGVATASAMRNTAIPVAAIRNGKSGSSRRPSLRFQGSRHMTIGYTDPPRDMAGRTDPALSRGVSLR